MESRRVDLIRRVDVTDIGCLEVQVTENERSFRILIDIGDAGVVDFQTVYFEWIDILYRLLPAALLDRGLIGRFTAELQQVHVDFRPVEPEFGDELPRKDLGPVDTGLENWKVDDRRIRVGLLHNGHLFQGQGEVQQLEVQFRQPHRIAFQVTVDVLFHFSAQRFIKEKRCHKENKAEGSRYTDTPANCL